MGVGLENNQLSIGVGPRNDLLKYGLWIRNDLYIRTLSLWKEI
jgi:hypothetical protein